MLKLGYFVLLLFVKNLKFINFSTNSKQRKEIISYLVELTDLIDGLFERGELSLTELINVLKNNNGKHPHNKKIIVLIKRIKDVSKNNECHQKFLYNLVKSWEAENIRRNNHFLIKDDTIKNAQDRGKFYFLALIYSLSPIQLNKNQIKIISICGSWFQIMDDYKDKKEDFGNKNTPFTISKENSLIMFNKYRKYYKKQLKNALNHNSSLILFMNWISILLLLLEPLLKIDWRNK
ncbi:MAG TPA: hypothetical protein VJZ93_04375 [Candidatus Nanoarchaeia archaeon]|nr:hypothetical protein [Candidatus Nanoarchaeia archaeon]